MNIAEKTMAIAAYIAYGSSEYILFSVENINGGWTIKIKPPMTNTMLIKFNLSIASFRKILADMQTKNVAEQDIILTSPSGMCFIAKYPIVIPQVPTRDRSNYV